MYFFERNHQYTEHMFMGPNKKAFEERHAEAMREKAQLMLEMARSTPSESDLYQRGREEALDAGNITEDEADEITADLWGTFRNCAPWMPTEANPWLLRWVKTLGELGSPVGSIDADTIEIGQSWKTKRGSEFDNAVCKDYTNYGWPLSEGNPLRWVTPEEDREILQRLRTSGLTKPGSEVSNVSWTFHEIMETEFPETPWLIEGLVRSGGAAMVYGSAGIGKTWLTLTLILLAAHGKGLAVADGGLAAGKGDGINVLLVDGEMTLRDHKERREALVAGMPGYDTEALKRIRLYPKAGQPHQADFFDLADRSWIATLVEYVKAEGFGLVVLDNLSTLSPTLEDENAATAWAPLNDAVVALKREGVATLLVHHAGKHENYRGSSNIVATLETVVALKKPQGGFGGNADAMFQVMIEKSRNHGRSTLDGKVLRLQSADGFGATWSLEVDEYSLVDAFVKAVKSLRFSTQEELGKALGYTQGHVSKTLQIAMAQKAISLEEYKRCMKEAKELRKALGDPEKALRDTEEF